MEIAVIYVVIAFAAGLTSATAGKGALMGGLISFVASNLSFILERGIVGLDGLYAMAIQSLAPTLSVAVMAFVVAKLKR